MNILTALMDRYRGTRGLFGWLVLRADVRWLRRMARIARELREQEQE